MIKYSCHIILVGQLRRDGWRDDHRRFRKVLKEDELCPRCERRLEKEMCRTLHWLKPRENFRIEIVYITRNAEEPMSSLEWPAVTDSESEPESADGSQEAENGSSQETDTYSDADESAEETEEHAREPGYSSGSEAGSRNSGQENDTKGNSDKDGESRDEV
jgi:hypothetical protein